MFSVNSVLDKYGSFNSDGFFCVCSDQVVQAISYLKMQLNFRQLIDMTAFRDASGIKLIYIFRNLRDEEIIKLLVPYDGTIKSITNLFPNAELYECEIFEKFNVVFANHPRLVPIFS